MRFAAIAIAVLSVLTAVSAHAGSGRADLDLGIVSVGELPANLLKFRLTDCGEDHDFADCSASDAQGREYVFFDGMLTRVSLKKNAVAEAVRLPAGLQFGESIEIAVHKAEKVYKINMDGGKHADGRVSYASDFVLGPKSGTRFSLELIADDRRRLVEIVQRVDLP